MNTRERLIALSLFLAPFALVACADSQTATEASSAATAPGSLVKLRLSSSVGVLLDEISDPAVREAAAQAALAQPDAFWDKRARIQAGLTYYKLVFRGLYYPSDWSNSSNDRGPLPLPPKSVWQVALGGPARRVTDPKHDMVVRDYVFSSVLVAPPDGQGGAADTEPTLATVGATWSESFNLPTDPTLLLQRTGYACMDEDEYPPGSVFELNTNYFFDDTCTKSNPANPRCHLTVFPQDSCVEALTKYTGIVKTSMDFTRLEWNAATADRYRVGTITNPNGADLEVIVDDMAEERSLEYKYFDPNQRSCELEEGVIPALGWRRLLRFSATVRNNGSQWMHIGDVTAASPWVAANVFEFSPCHGHYHFTHYGTFGFGGAPGSKRAFCLEDTNRFHNSETSTLRPFHQSCHYQGITAGWGDEYEWGIPGQWVDITDVRKTADYVTFVSNPDKFLCEGRIRYAADGVTPLFEFSGFYDSAGVPVNRVQCDFGAGWNDNNYGQSWVDAPKGRSFVTSPCRQDELGPKRDCAFSDFPDARKRLKSCAPGSTVTLQCSTSGSAQLLRICERSDKLAGGVACALKDAVSNATISSGATTSVQFACPVVRDAAAGTGGYSVYQGAMLPAQGLSTVTCTGL